MAGSGEERGHLKYTLKKKWEQGHYGSPGYGAQEHGYLQTCGKCVSILATGTAIAVVLAEYHEC